jgi:hypothetical protein
MAGTGNASARMEQTIMHRLMFGPPMTAKNLDIPIRKVGFELGPVDNYEAVSPYHR